MADDATVQITTVSIQMGDKIVTLTVEQARALKRQLEELFGVKVEEHHHFRDYIPWKSPYWYSTVAEIKTEPDQWRIWCQNGTHKATAMLCLGNQTPVDQL